MSNLVCFVGAPGAGKTTLTERCVDYYRNRGINAGSSQEYARFFISKYGHPEHTALQFHVLEQQLEWERKATRGKDIAFTDTAAYFSYIFPMIYRTKTASDQEMLVLSEIYEKVTKHISNYHYTFYVPLRDEVEDDGVRVPGDSPMIDAHLKEFIMSHQQLFPHMHFIPSGLSVEESVEYVTQELAKEGVCLNSNQLAMF